MKFYFHYKSPDSLYGPSITTIYMEDDGKMWVENGEYASQVNFCPFTGTPAETKMEVVGTEHNRKIYQNKK